MAVFRESGVKGLTLQYFVGVAKLSVEGGFLLLRAYNWGWIHCPLYGVAGCPLFRGF